MVWGRGGGQAEPQVFIGSLPVEGRIGKVLLACIVAVEGFGVALIGHISPGPDRAFIGQQTGVFLKGLPQLDRAALDAVLLVLPLQPQPSGFGKGGPAQLGIVENLLPGSGGRPSGWGSGDRRSRPAIQAGVRIGPEGGFVVQQPGRHRRCFAGRWLRGGWGAIGFECDTGGPVIGQRLGQQVTGMGPALGQGLVVDAELRLTSVALASVIRV